MTADVHLTNVAVQKTAPDYDPEKGSKWSVRQLRLYLAAKHGQPLVRTSLLRFITFRVSRRRRKMYCGHARLCVCVCVCVRVWPGRRVFSSG